MSSAEQVLSLEQASTSLLRQVDSLIELGVKARTDRQPVYDTIVDFVNLLSQIPEARRELSRRAGFVLVQTGIGSSFTQKITAARSAYKHPSVSASTVRDSIENLLSTKVSREWLGDIIAIRKAVNAITQSSEKKLTRAESKALVELGDACRDLEAKAAGLEVDGCRLLIHLHMAQASEAPTEAQRDRTIFLSQLGAASLPKIRNAAKLMSVWAAEHAHSLARTASATVRAPEVVGFLSVNEICDAYEIAKTKRSAFRKALERARLTLGNEDLQEIQNLEANRARYLYRVQCDVIQKLVEDYRPR